MVNTKTTPAHLTPNACFVCGEQSHADTTKSGGHKFWANHEANAHFCEPDGQGAYSPEATYVATHRPY